MKKIKLIFDIDLRLVYAKNCSLIGNIVFNTILELWLLEKYNSATVLSNAVTLSGITAIVCSFIGGYLADNKYSIRIMILLNLISGIICATPLVFGYSLPVIYLMVLLLNFSSNLSSPIYKKIIAFVYKGKQLPLYNEIMVISSQILSITVAPISTFLFSLKIIDILPAISINILSFFVTAFLIKSLNVQHLESQKRSVGFIKVFKKIILNNEFGNNAKRIFLSNFWLNIFFTGYNIILIYVCTMLLNSKTLYSIVLFCESLGGIIGGFSYILWKFDKKILVERILLVIGSIVLYFSVVLQFNNGIPVSSLILAIAMTRYAVSSQSILQLDVEKENIGKVFSLLYIFSNIAIPIGSVFFGKFLDTNISIAVLLFTLGICATNIVWRVYKNE